LALALAELGGLRGGFAAAADFGDAGGTAALAGAAVPSG
jgi:hypothetical protein